MMTWSFTGRATASQHYFILQFNESFTKGDEHVSSESNEHNVYNIRKNAVLLTSSLMDAKFFIPKGIRIRSVRIILGSDILNNYIGRETADKFLSNYFSMLLKNRNQTVPGLHEPVDVVRDKWGIPHIYAKNTEDLFFAQGYVMAQDRLWEMEWWRRDLEGRLSEILGPDALEHDRLARLLEFRGPYDEAEWTNYHADGKRILTAYADGINAFIAAHADNLPVEFQLTGIKPLPWTAETVVLREPAFGNARDELRLAMNVGKYRCGRGKQARGA